MHTQEDFERLSASIEASALRGADTIRSAIEYFAAWAANTDAMTENVKGMLPGDRLLMVTLIGPYCDQARQLNLLAASMRRLAVALAQLPGAPCPLCTCEELRVDVSVRDRPAAIQCGRCGWRSDQGDTPAAE